MRASVWAEQGLAAAGRPDEQNVGLGELDLVAFAAMGEALVVVVHCHREDPLRVILADHVVGQHLADLGWRGHPVAALDPRALVLLADDVHAQLDALVADEHGGPRDELAYLVLALAAERAVERVLRIAAAGLVHVRSVPSYALTGLLQSPAGSRRSSPDNPNAPEGWHSPTPLSRANLYCPPATLPTAGGPDPRPATAVRGL